MYNKNIKKLIKRTAFIYIVLYYLVTLYNAIQSLGSVIFSFFKKKKKKLIFYSGGMC